MAKRRRRPKKQERRRTQRDRRSISKPRGLLRSQYIIRDEKRRWPPITQDRRLWHPDRDEVRYDDGRRVEYDQVAPRKVRKYYERRDATQDWIGFVNPDRVPICKRRKRRRVALFALRKIGKGKGGAAKRRMTRFSRVRC